MDILIIGSGPSVKLLPKLNLDAFTVICLNNAWELVPWEKIAMWSRSTDLETFRKNIAMPGLRSSPKINGGHGALAGVLYQKPGEIYDNTGEKKSTVFCDTLAAITSSKDGVIKSVWFIGCEHDYTGKETHFYGTGHPDPLRYGEEWLLLMFRRFRGWADAYGISLVNATGNYNGLLHKGMFQDL
jgi:hypothetical protein